MARTAVVRADASAGVGLGHVMRSLTLARALVARGWHVVLVTGMLPEGIAERAHAASIAVLPLEGPPHGASDAAVALSIRPDLVIADGYHFEPSFYESFLEARPHLCVIDDNGENIHRSARVVVNQNPSATEELYGGPSSDRALLLGLRYALLRDEVTAGRIEPVTSPSEGAFVSMGGSDPLGLGERLATALSRSGVSTKIALGPAMRHRDAVRERLCRLSHVEIVRDHDFVNELSMSAVAVVGAGTTMWEAAYLGVPSVSIIVADNQAAPAQAADALGFTLAVDARTEASTDTIVRPIHEMLADAARRERMSQVGRGAVDGRGAIRVAAFLSEFVDEKVRTLC